MAWYVALIKTGSLSATDDGAKMVVRATALAPTVRYSARIVQLVPDHYPPELAIEIEPPNELAPAGSSGERLAEIHLEAHFDRLTDTSTISGRTSRRAFRDKVCGETSLTHQ